jgi:arylformamidase
MKIYDISLPISNDLPVWPGDPSVSLKLANSIIDGDQCNVTQMQMGVHTGTHIDAPYHFLKDGATTDFIPIETIVGRCIVIESYTNDIIGKKELQNINLSGFKRVLLKTRNSELWANNCSFNTGYIALGYEAAQYLIEIDSILVGIDYLSIESFKSRGGPVHKLLLENNVTILEGLNLYGVRSGVYELICLPLKLKGCDGAPARVILREC